MNVENVYEYNNYRSTYLNLVFINKLSSYHTEHHLHLNLFNAYNVTIQTISVEANFITYLFFS